MTDSCGSSKKLLKTNFPNKIKETLKKTKRNINQRIEYEDLDESWLMSNRSVFQPYQLSERRSSVKLSISDTALNLQSVVPNAAQYQSTLSLGNSVNIGSICLLRGPTNSEPEALNDKEVSTTIARQPKHRRKQNIWLVCYVIFYIGFLAVGGLCFQMMEGPVEEKNRILLQETRNDFLKQATISDDDLEKFLRAVIAANDRGISPLRNASNDMNWSFGQALFFSSTVITTIGYGRVTPLSQTGKIFCMIYATIGIPLTLVLLSAVVERLLIPANWFLGTLNSKFGHLYQPFNIRLLHLSLIVVIVSILFFIIPTAVFAYFEPTWGPLDAFYYCFISLTTIGLGDYIPGDGVSADNRSFYKISITCYLVFGLIAMMFVLTIFYDIPQLNLGQLFTESLNGESEKLRLSSNNATCYSGTSGLYMPQRDEDARRAVVRIRPHGNDSPSPEEAPSPSRELRIP